VSESTTTPAPPRALIDYLRLAGEHLRAKGIESHRLDAELLMAEALGASRVELYTNYERPLSRDEVDRYRELLRRRAAREPIAYILGKREFWSLDLLVDRRVLIPRPETETLVETTVRACTGRLGVSSAPTRYEQADEVAGDDAARAVEATGEPEAPAAATRRVLDIGTGSGAIAVAIAVELPMVTVVASDDSAASLEVAPKNAERHGVADRIEFRCGDLFAAVEPNEVFDVIVSNPPYCKDDELATMEPEVREWEPRGALFGGPDGMRETARIIEGAAQHLAADGWLILEVGTQAQTVRDALVHAGWREVRSVLDLAGRERVVAARRPASDASGEGGRE
jgi:release factor glutamine methyltransferase